MPGPDHRDLVADDGLDDLARVHLPREVRRDGHLEAGLALVLAANDQYEVIAWDRVVVVAGDMVDLPAMMADEMQFLRLAFDDTEALRTFPELVEAAQGALDAGNGFARHWKSDGEYLAQVQAAAIHN